MKSLLWSTAACLLIWSSPALAQADYSELLGALPNAQHSLADALAQVSTGGEVPIETKFEVKDGVLLLGAYTVEQPLDVRPEQNVFKEYNGDATQAAWEPETEVFEDFAHIARSASYQTLLAISPVGMTDILEKATAAAGDGTVFSIKALVIDGKPVYEVLTAKGDAVETSHYDLMTGDALTG